MSLPPAARFWMVCRLPTGPHSKTEPRQRYASADDARAAAEKLAQETGAPFVILQPVAMARPGDAQQEPLL